MELLEQNASQKRPTFSEAREMCQQISLELISSVDARVQSVLQRLRETHLNGGALFASFNVGPSEVFNWFASSNQLPIFGILRQLLDRQEIIAAVPDLEIEPLKPDDPALVTHKLRELTQELYPEKMEETERLGIHGIGPDFEIANQDYEGEFKLVSSFGFDGKLADKLYNGGAYTRAEGNGKAEKESALAFCEALFDSRFSEVSIYETNSAWTRWFGNIAWHWTVLLFDRRSRTLSILAVTDTD